MSVGEPPYLVGRTKEIELIEAAIGGLANGRGSSFFIGSKSGLGKSRLLRYYCDAHTKRGLTLQASCARLPVSYTGLLERLSRPLRPKAEGRTHSVASFLEQLKTKLRGRGAMILVDDIHYATQGDLDLLEVLVNASRENRICLVATFLDVAGRPPMSLAEPLLRWSAYGATIHALSPLTETTLELLIRSVVMPSSQPLPPTEVDRIVRASGGNPRYALELLHEARSTGTTKDIPPMACAIAASLRQALSHE